MAQDELEKSLDELRGEIDQVTNAETREHLDNLVEELEESLERYREEQDETIIGPLKGLIEQYEVEYPKITSILNQMMVSLSNMGI